MPSGLFYLNVLNRIIQIEGMSSQFILLPCSKELPVLKANSVDPNKTPCFETSDLCSLFANIYFMDARQNITKRCLYNFDPLKPHFYIVKLGFTGVYIIFLISAQKHRLWVFVRTASVRRF